MKPGRSRGAVGGISRTRPHEFFIEPPALPETVANTPVCPGHQTDSLLDRQLRSGEREFLKGGGFTERLYHAF